MDAVRCLNGASTPTVTRSEGNSHMASPFVASFPVRPNSQLIRDVRRAVNYEYRHGAYPTDMSDDVAAYLIDGGLVNALVDLEAALAALEERDTSSAHWFRRLSVICWVW